MWKKLASAFRIISIVISSCVPTQKKVWVFGAWFGQRFADNPKYFLLYVKKLKGDNIRPIWIYKKSRLSSLQQQYDIECYAHNSLKGIYFQLIARWAFFSHSVSADLNPAVIGWNTKRLQMWHGVPLKKIMYDNKDEAAPWKNNAIYRLLLNTYNSYVLSPSPGLSSIFSSAFNVSRDDIIDSGYPRNDVFFTRASSHIESNQRFKAIYMPTFRKFEGNQNHLFDDTYGFNVGELDEILRSNNIELTIRVHPANTPDEHLMKEIKKSENFVLSLTDDIYEEINDYQCLITDYSSIMFDYALTGRPIIFSAFDFEQYTSGERKLYYSYDELTDNCHVYSWQQLTTLLLKYKDDPNCYANSSLMTSLINADGIEPATSTENRFSKALFTAINQLDENK